MPSNGAEVCHEKALNLFHVFLVFKPLQVWIQSLDGRKHAQHWLPTGDGLVGHGHGAGEQEGREL